MITGIIKAISSKSHKDQIKASQGYRNTSLLIDGAWYNIASKYPVKVKTGDKVSFGLFGETETLVDTKTLHIIEYADGSSTQSDNTPEVIRKLIDRVKDHTTRIEALEASRSPHSEAQITPGVTITKGKATLPAKVKEAVEEQEDPFNDALEF